MIRQFAKNGAISRSLPFYVIKIEFNGLLNKQNVISKSIHDLQLCLGCNPMFQFPDVKGNITIIHTVERILSVGGV